VHNVSYLASLRGANGPEEMNGLLGMLGALVVFAVVAFSAQFWLALSSGWSSHTFISLVSQLISVLLWIIVDTGNRLDAHGQLAPFFGSFSNSRLTFIINVLHRLLQPLDFHSHFRSYQPDCNHSRRLVYSCRGARQSQ